MQHPDKDPVLTDIIRELKKKHRCHTILLCGSRARGLVTSTSDYDVVGVRRSGEKTRLAKKKNGAYWDVSIHPEKSLQKLHDGHFGWKDAQLLYSESNYGRQLLCRVAAHIKKPFKPNPQYEIDVLKVWAQKQLDRCRINDINGLFRRAEFQMSLVDHYFYVRQMRFWGPKAGLAWLAEHDPKTFKLIQRALKHPTNISFLKAAAKSVYQVPLS
jgi:hypothetical protein